MSSIRSKIAIIYECLDAETRKRIDAKMEEEDRKYQLQEEQSLKKLQELKNRLLRLWPLLIIFGIIIWFADFIIMIPMMCICCIIIYYSH